MPQLCDSTFKAQQAGQILQASQALSSVISASHAIAEV